MTLPLNTEYVTRAFAGGKVTTPQGPVECFIRQAGDLVLPTGRIVACDPLVFDEAEPFTVAVGAGSYPVSLAVAKVSETDQRVAFAKVTFAFADPVAWKWQSLQDRIRPRCTLITFLVTRRLRDRLVYRRRSSSAITAAPSSGR